MTILRRLALAALLVLALALTTVNPPPSGAAGERTYAAGIQVGTTGYDAVTGVATHRGATYDAGFEGARTFLHKRRPNGSVIWTRNIDGRYGRALTTDASGVYVAGHQWIAGNTDVYVRKYDHSGRPLWTIPLGTAQNDYPNRIVVSGGHLYVLGLTQNSGAIEGLSAGGTDFWVAKYSVATQSQVWAQQVGTSGNDEAKGLVVLGGDVYFSGTVGTTMPGQSSEGQNDAVLVRLNGTTGVLAWSRQLGSPLNDSMHGLATDGQRLYGAGDTLGIMPGGTGGASRDAFAVAYDTAGNRLWLTQFGAPFLPDYATVAEWDGDALLVAGLTTAAVHPTAGGWDAYVQRISRTGGVGWAAQRGSAGNESVNDMAVGRNGVHVAGDTDGSIGGPNRGEFDGYLLRWVTHRSDALGKAGRRFVGNDAYGAGQRVSGQVRRGDSTTFTVRAQNDGEASERLAVKGCAGPAGLTVRYFKGRRDVTSAVRRGSFRTPVLENGGRLDLKVRVAAARNARLATSTCAVIVSTTQGPAVRDRLTLATRVVR